MGASLFGLLDVAQSGLEAQTAGLDATGQNVANVNTPGYSRVEANLEPVDSPAPDGGGVIDAGTTRDFSQLTFNSMLTQQGLGGAADARSTALTETEEIISPQSNTIGDDVNSFFTSLQTLETSPSDPSARQGVLGAATTLADSISGAANQLATQQNGLATQAQQLASSVNSELAQIAALNTQINEVTGSGGTPNSLEDQRDQLVSEVSSSIGCQVVTDSNGDYTLLSSGTALVTNGTAATLSVTASGANQALTVTANLGSGSDPVDITANVTSGTMGGILEANNTDIPNVSAQLDQFAYNLSTEVNAIQSAGYGLDGVTGRNLFVQPTTVTGAAAEMAVDPSVANDPDAIAASSTAAGLPGGNDNAVAMAQLADEALGTNENPSTAYASIASSVGALSSSANDEQTLRQATITQAQNVNSSISGVSLDQEMTNLDQFQRAYEASGEVLQTANTLLGELITDLGSEAS